MGDHFPDLQQGPSQARTSKLVNHKHATYQRQLQSLRPAALTSASGLLRYQASYAEQAAELERTEKDLEESTARFFVRQAYAFMRTYHVSACQLRIDGSSGCLERKWLSDACARTKFQQILRSNLDPRWKVRMVTVEQPKGCIRHLLRFYPHVPWQTRLAQLFRCPVCGCQKVSSNPVLIPPPGDGASEWHVRDYV